MAKWWDQDMSDAGQLMYQDPSTALQVATMPNAVLQGQQLKDKRAVEKQSESARLNKAGFMGKIGTAFGFAKEAIDKTGSKIPGFGVAKNFTEFLWTPVDKLASGAYWLYSEAVSQPLSTYILQAGKADLSGDLGVLTNPGEWVDAYQQAENISPGQAAANYGSAKGMAINSGDSAVPLGGGLDADEKRQAERLLYDTEYWRDKQGWKYTVGTGAVDFTVTMAADPTYAAVKAAGIGVKAARNVRVAEEGLGTKKAEDIATGTKVNDFFDWSVGKTPYEISQHPIWGKGRRKNPFAQQYGEVFSKASRDDMPLILRFNAGDNQAMAALGNRSKDTAVTLGRLNENRQVLDSAKFDPEILSHFVGEEAAGRAAATAPTGIGGTSAPTVGSQLVEPPYPRPTQPGPRQAGWDATYGHLAKQAAAYRGAASEILKVNSGQVRNMFDGAAISADDITAAENWRAGTLQAYNAEIGAQAGKMSVYSDLLGPNLGKDIEDYAAGTSNLFGTAKTLYRMGPLGPNVARVGDKAVAKSGRGRGDWVKEGGVIGRTARNGFYSAPVRFVNTFGERLPETMINHNADDAPQRVMDMLKQVRGLGAEQRVAMAGEYSSAPDKVSRSQVLQSIHGAIIDHYGTANNLDPQVIDIINRMTQDGIGSTMMKLTGTGPTAQRFSAAENAEGKMVDLIDDGEGLIVAPMAKTQLSQGEALLPVRDFERFIDRHSGSLQGFKQFNGSAIDFMSDKVDGLSKIWKASTLLRPAYPIRSVSEEAAAAAVKFGLLSSIMGGSRGGVNFFRNRGQEVVALVGKGSYVPTTGKGVESQFARVRIEDPDALRAAEKYDLKTQRIKVNDAWPIVEARIRQEQDAVRSLDKQIERAKGIGEDWTELAATRSDHEAVIAEHEDYAKAILSEATDSAGRRVGDEPFTYRGETVHSAFSKEWENPIARDQVSSSRAKDFLFSRGESIDLGRFVKSGDWTVIGPKDPNHTEAWLGAINKQFRQDELFRLVAQDSTLKGAQGWLKTSAGKQHLSDLGPWAREPENLVKAIKTTLDQYLPEGTGLQAKLARNEEIYEVELKSAIHADDYPMVHGEEVKALTRMFSRETASYKTNEIISKGYDFLGSTPSDLLVRHPTFNKAYQARMTDLIDQHKNFRISQGADESISLKEMNQMYEKATKLAKNDIRQVVYDPTRTTATEALRFVHPFLSAHTDTLQRWAGLIGEKPQFLAGVAKIYNAPVAAHLTTDDQGNYVDQSGHASVTDPITGKEIERKFVPIEQRVINMRLPWDTKSQNKVLGKIPGYGVPIKIQAMNTILPGDPWFNPGTGPLVQIPASAIAKMSPSTGDFLQWSKVLPYGPNDNWYDALTPKYTKAAWDAFTTDDPDNEKYQQAFLDVYNRQVAEHADGGPPPDFAKVEKEAKQFMFLQALTAWASPAQTRETPLTGTPYQFFVDQYKKLQETNPKDAKDIFLSTYGSNYFGFTTSLSKSLGVAPTVAAMTTAEEYRDLIDKDPDMASWIVGDTYNTGAFSASVYRKQMETAMGGEKLREKRSAISAINDNQVQLGWTTYMKLKGYADAALIQAGFRSYEQKGAEGFKQLKDQMTDTLAQAYPEWDKERGQINTTKIPSRIKFFEKALQDKRLQSDPMRFDLPGLAVYLETRKVFQNALRQRGAKALSFDPMGNPTGQNADLGYAWRQTQMGIVNSNTQFNDVFNRYLENDDLS